MTRLVSLLMSLLFIATTLAQEGYKTFRLPNNTRPETYDVSIRTWIDAGNFTFIGSVRIGILAVQTSSFITLHHRVDRIESVRVSKFLFTDEVPLYSDKPLYDEERNFLTIPLVGNKLIQGMRYFLDIDYVGEVNDISDNGFYRHFYDDNDTRKWFGSTQFESTYARKAFPCYDEPALRSTFKIRLTHVSSYTAISNMPAIFETLNSDGSVTTEFETTPLMPTYLVAFHISDFSYVTSLTPGEIPQRIFAQPTAWHATELALEACESLIDVFREYFGIEYPMPKMDHVAVPGFSGGMENWGIATYTESAFLVDEAVDSFTRKINAVRLTSHELSHQWFGNLVVPRWWTYLWLKEGFATFFEFLGIDLVYPDWRMADFFVTDLKQNVFLSDADELTQPMTFYVERPDEIMANFNIVAYNKSASVLRMFWFMFGEEAFMRGLKLYLIDNSYSDAAEEDLFEALHISILQEDENIIPPTVDVASIMTTWTRQAGFPLVTVERNYDNRTDRVTLRQTRYYTIPPTDPENTTWWIPYNLVTPRYPGFADTKAEGWIPHESSSWDIVVDSLSADDYLLVNKMAAGYYRTMYDERNYRLVSDAILRDDSLFHSTDISQLIDDAFEFYKTSRLPVTVLLNLLRVLEFQTDFISWSPAFNCIYHIDQRFRGHRNYRIWADFVLNIAEELYDSVGFQDVSDEPILRKYSRENIVKLVCEMGSVQCRHDANWLLRRHIAIGADFHQNVRQTLMCASLHNAGRIEFYFIWNRLLSLPVDQKNDRADIINWLGCSTSRQLLSEFIRSSLHSTNSNNATYTENEQIAVFRSVLRHGGDVGLGVGLDFLIENAVEAYETFDLWNGFLDSLSTIVRTEDHIERYRIFLKKLLDAELIEQEEIDSKMDELAKTVRWLESEGELVNNWLLENFV